jgi:hypothetical protein
MTTKDLDATARFLLDCPPLEEIGNPLVDVIEQYRFQMLTEQQALEILTNKFQKLLQKITNDNIAINKSM